jgi:hypothetical protein
LEKESIMFDQKGMYNYRNRPIPGRELRAAIKTAIKTFKEPPTRLEICKRLKRSKSPHIINEIRDMVLDGVLIEKEIQFGGTVAYVYTIRGSEE